MKTILSIICCLLLFACETKEPVVKNTKITYSIQSLQNEGTAAASALLLQLLNDASHERIVYTNGKQSCVKESNDDFYFRGIMTTVKNSADTTAFYSKPFPYLTFWWPYPYLEPMSVTEKSFYEVQFTSAQKDILGYHCKKATITDEYYRYNVWYTTDFKVDDPTQALLHKDSIPGVILEMDRAFNTLELPYYQKYKVTSIDFENTETGIYDIPKGAVKIHPDQADAKNWALMIKDMAKKEAANPYPQSEKNKFEGHWILAVGKDHIKVSIKRKPKTDDYFVSEVYTQKGQQQPYDTFKARFYHNKLIVKHSPNYESYIFTKDGKLKKETGDFFTFTKL